MKNANQIRQLLKDAIEYKADYAYGYVIKKCKEALALLPCESHEIPEKKEPLCNFLRWCEWENRDNCEGCVYYLKLKRGFGL